MNNIIITNHFLDHDYLRSNRLINVEQLEHTKVLQQQDDGVNCLQLASHDRKLLLQRIKLADFESA